VSSYKRFIIFSISLVFLLGCSPSQSNIINYNDKSFKDEDRDILFALEYDRSGDKEQARSLYLSLYERTMKDEYLLEYIKISFALQNYDDIVKIIKTNQKRIVKSKNQILRIYILTLIQQKNLDEALNATNELIKENNSNLNHELLGNIFLQKNDYKNAKKEFEYVYKNSFDENSLIELINIMYIYLNEKNEAINLLESHIKLYGCTNLTCSKLLNIYQEENDIDGIISVLKKSYYQYKDKSNHMTMDRIYKLLMYYLEKKDINEAIIFLEKSRADDQKLLDLYRNIKEYKKAYSLVKELYTKTANIDYLAQIAMLEFESAVNKKDVLKSVIKKFDDVLVVLDNHIYQNYLGYLLIDFDIDINRGIALIKKALEKAPNNLAYIDSLAWGQYKQKNCKEAYKNMKIVVDNAGLNDEEIKSHWKEIKECNK